MNKKRLQVTTEKLAKDLLEETIENLAWSGLLDDYAKAEAGSVEDVAIILSALMMPQVIKESHNLSVRQKLALLDRLRFEADKRMSEVN